MLPEVDLAVCAFSRSAGPSLCGDDDCSTDEADSSLLPIEDEGFEVRFMLCLVGIEVEVDSAIAYFFRGCRSPGLQRQDIVGTCREYIASIN